MNRDEVQTLLEAVAAGRTRPADAADLLATAPYTALADSLLDLHRELRTGDPEVVYAAGKTTDQVQQIVRALRAASTRAVLVTRCSDEVLAALTAEHEDVQVAGSAVAVGALPEPRGRVAVVSAGTSDGPVAAEAALTVRVFGAAADQVHDVGVAGLHRLLAARPVLDTADCVVVVAGMDGALPSVIGGLVGTPLVAVPTSVGYGASFGGVAALLTMLNSCAAGTVVVNIDNGFGAGVHAARIARRAVPRGYAT